MVPVCVDFWNNSYIDERQIVGNRICTCHLFVDCLAVNSRFGSFRPAGGAGKTWGPTIRRDCKKMQYSLLVVPSRERSHIKREVRKIISKSIFLEGDILVLGEGRTKLGGTINSPIMRTVAQAQTPKVHRDKQHATSPSTTCDDLRFVATEMWRFNSTILINLHDSCRCSASKSAKKCLKSWSQATLTQSLQGFSISGVSDSSSKHHPRHARLGFVRTLRNLNISSCDPRFLEMFGNPKSP